MTLRDEQPQRHCHGRCRVGDRATGETTKGSCIKKRLAHDDRRGAVRERSD